MKEAVEIKTWGTIEDTDADADKGGHDEEQGIILKKSAESEENGASAMDNSAKMEKSDDEQQASPKYHQSNPEPIGDEQKQKERDFRKKLNQTARETVSGSIHQRVKLIVHRPDYDQEHRREYAALSQGIMPIVKELARQTQPLLEHEIRSELARNHYYGSKFLADSIAYKDYRVFAKKRPPSDSPSLAVGVRLDESASMSAMGRLEAAKRAVIAVYEFCQRCQIPVLIYGDTADVSRMEQMSIYAYADWERTDSSDRYRLMGIRARSNNRDGMALRIMAQRLAEAPQQTKLLISISDGQPKAMDDYTGRYAVQDMQQTIAEYERKGITFLAAAIGQDKEKIAEIYGKERFLDITDLQEFPSRLVRIIARYL